MSVDRLTFRWEQAPNASQSAWHELLANPAWAAVAHRLMERAGEWAVVYESPNFELVSRLGTAVRRGQVALPPGVWEAVTKSDVHIENGKVNSESKRRLFLRYIGPIESVSRLTLVGAEDGRVSKPFVVTAR